MHQICRNFLTLAQCWANGDIQTMMIEQNIKKITKINPKNDIKTLLKSHNFLFRLAKRWRSAPEFFKLSNVGPTATFDDRIFFLEITKTCTFKQFRKVMTFFISVGETLALRPRFL